MFSGKTGSEPNSFMTYETEFAKCHYDVTRHIFLKKHSIPVILALKISNILTYGPE